MNKRKTYPLYFAAPAFIIFIILFLFPNLISFYYSFTIWDLKNAVWCGLDNYKMFLTDPGLMLSIKNTLIYAVTTCGLKVIVGFVIAVFLTSGLRTKNLLRSIVFFATLISSVAVGIMFKAMLHPTKGIVNTFLQLFSIQGPDWLGNTGTALGSVIFADVWKGLGIAVVIFIAGIQSIDRTYYESASLDGASKIQIVKDIMIPLSKSARNSVIILSFISGIRSFELIWSMTKGGPGFATDVLGSIVYKEYSSGYYGLSTTGNVIMLIFVMCLAFPLQKFLNKNEEV